jgi:hypothetical protein
MNLKEKLERERLESSLTHDQAPGGSCDATGTPHRHSLQPIQYRYDFDIGYLSKSPCQGCGMRPLFPRCINRCRALDQIHATLTGTVSCSRNS